MKKFLKFLMFPVLLFSAMQFSSCNSLHIHDLEYKYNEETHWEECKICHKKIGETEHSIDATDRCLICDYHDPVIKTNGSKTLTGLTKHGKTKNVLSLDENIIFIENNVFTGSECSKLYITPEFVGFRDCAFENSKITKKEDIVDPDEKFVDWILYDGVYYRDDHFLNNECMIKDGENTKYYKTFREAVESDGPNETTITLLKKEITLDGNPLIINRKITLEVMPGILETGQICKINGNNSKFLIQPSGYLRIPNDVSYLADTYLILGIKEEVSGPDEREKVYTSGSLIYTNCQTEPTGRLPLNVVYVDDSSNEYKANISKQTTGGSGSLAETPNYAYGVFKFNKDFTQIKGLTDFGETCTSLTICRPMTEDSHPGGWIIGPRAFTRKGYIDIPIPILPDPRVQLWKQKGSYANLIIGDGITAIGSQAFANYVDSIISPTVRLQIAALISPIHDLKISNEVKTIGNGAFTECVYLDRVSIGDNLESQLTEIFDNAFSNCILLKTVDFSNCLKLNLIKYKAFWGCVELEEVFLPFYKCWTVNGYSYLPEELLPENAATLFRSTHAGDDWHHDGNVENTKFAWCNKSDIKGGVFNKVHYCSSFPDESAYNDEATIFVFKDAGLNVNLWENKTINKSINIIAYDEDTEPDTDITFGETNISKNKYLKVSKKIRATNRILIRSENSEHSFKNIGGFAREIGKDAGHEPPSGANVGYAVNDSQPANYQANYMFATINGKNYRCYGLFNFNINDNIANTEGGGNGLSNLGKQASKIWMSKILLSDSYKSQIGDKSFQYYKGGLEEIEIDDSYEFIRNWAFEGCTNLKRVKLGSNVTWLGDRVFRNCSQLEKVEFVNNTKLNAIYKEVFDGCNNLKSLDLGNNVNGWTVDGRAISSSDLSDTGKAANLLSKVYNKKVLFRK